MIRGLNSARVVLGFVVALQAFFVSGADDWLAENVLVAWGFSEPWANAFMSLAFVLVIGLAAAGLVVKLAVEGPLWGAVLALAAGAGAIWLGSQLDQVASNLSDPRVGSMESGVMLAWAILATSAFAAPFYRLIVRRRHEESARRAAAELRRLERRELSEAGQPRWRQIGTRSYLERPASPLPAATAAQQAALRARMRRIVEHEAAKADTERFATPPQNGTAPGCRP